MLQVQYRSHPVISKFPREYFYQGKLEDGPNVLEPSYTKEYHKVLQPLVFFNVLDSVESSDFTSRQNLSEASLCYHLYCTLREKYAAIEGQVGVITPYSQQQRVLRTLFRNELDRDEVEINTVDGFQGREKDIIILSTVRADPNKNIGFLSDIRRMNVALTRAKYACYVVGNEKTLVSSKPWRAFLDHVWDTKCLIHIEGDPRDVDLLDQKYATERSKSRSASPNRPRKGRRSASPRGGRAGKRKVSPRRRSPDRRQKARKRRG